jgi:hypothetical protein
VRGVACLSLARFLASRVDRFEAVRGDAKLVGEFEELYGRDYVQAVLKADGAAALKEAEALLERAAADFADVKDPEGTTIGEAAAAKLFELRSLRIGRTAPEIEGVDQEGTPFKLSDYRGKVVLLDFWHEQ